MALIRITKEFRFEGAHALIGYDGKCRHIHGHSYILYVTVAGTPSTDESDPKLGMLTDFSQLKALVNRAVVDRFDHALVMREGAPLCSELQAAYQNVIRVPFQPTCENLIVHFAGEIRKVLPGRVRLFSLRLHETATSYVEWFASDNPEEPKTGQE